MSSSNFFVIKANDETKSPYYAQLKELKNDPKFLKQLFNYFKTKDISNFDPVRDMPHSEYEINFDIKKNKKNNK